MLSRPTPATQEQLEELYKAHLERIAAVHSQADLGRHVGEIIHDLASPLTDLDVSLEALLIEIEKEQLSNKELTLLVENAMQGATQLKRLVMAVRKQLARQKLEAEFVVEEEISHALLTLKYRARFYNVQLIPAIQQGSLFGNAISFYKVVQNLISNALDAYEHVKRKNNRLVAIRYFQEQNWGVLEVQDFAHGIPEENLQDIYQPFYTTKSPSKGTGVGLTIVKTIVEQEFHGLISTESKEGLGTTVHIFIPLNRPN